MKKIVLTVIIAIIACIAVTAMMNRPGDAAGMEKEDFTPDPGQELEERDMKKIQPQSEVIRVLACGVDYSHELTDVIMYVQYDPKTMQVNLLSIPRDSYLGEEYVTGKINQVYRQTGRMEELVREVEERFHLDIDYYATITLEALGSIVDEVGGIEVTIDDDLYDYGNLVFSKGTQVLDGEKTQLFVRLRHAYANADLGRISAQQKFLMAALDKAQSMGKLTALRLLMKNFSALKTDMPLGKMISVASTAFGIQKENIHMFTAPGIGKMNGEYAVYEVDKEGLAEILNEHFLSTPITADDLDFPTVDAPPYVAEPALPEEEDQEEEPEIPEESVEETEDGEEEGDGRPHARKLTPEEVEARRKAREEKEQGEQEY